VRGIKYAAASRLIASVSGILDRPIKSGDDNWERGALLLNELLPIQIF
jgi:hypothetical protein